MTSRRALFIALLLTLSVPAQARAQGWEPDATPMTLDQALRAAQSKNPSLRAALLDAKSARLALAREEAQFTPMLSAEVGYRRGARPALNRAGVTLLTQDSTSITAQGDYTFATTGTSLSVSTGLSREFQDSAALGRLGPAYNLSLLMSVTQPLLRGFGKDATQAAISAARLQRDASEQARLQTASALLRDVIVAYWELWYAAQAIEIQRQDLDLAKSLLADGELRVSAGTLAPDEVLTLQADTARSEESLVAAEVAWRERALNLSQLTGMPPAAAPPDDAPPEATSSPGLNLIWEQVLESSVTLRQIKSEIEIARVNAALARDTQQVRLDAIGWMQLAGLGDSLGSTAQQFASANTISGYIGMRVALPANNAAARADTERAEIAVTTAQLRYEAEVQRLRRTLSVQHDAWRTTATRLTLAQRTADLASQSADAQRRRFDAGAATALDIVRAQQQEREAALRVARARADIAISRVTLDDLSGALLDSVAELESSP